jgi:Uma2 family endonuclease
MQVVLPDEALPARLTLNPDLRMSDDDYYDFCVANPNLRLERTAQGEIVIVPPAGLESDNRNAKIIIHFGQWALRDGRGEAFGPSAEYILPSGAAYSPDVSWISNARLNKLTKKQLRRFPPVVPEFVVEVMSPSDRLKAAKQKMDDWMANGVDLAWLIDGDRKTVWIYRAGHEPEKRTGITDLPGEGPIAGFVLDLRPIWQGL